MDGPPLEIVNPHITDLLKIKCKKPLQNYLLFEHFVATNRPMNKLKPRLSSILEDQLSIIRKR